MFTIAVEMNTSDEGRAQRLYDVIAAATKDIPEIADIFIWEVNHIYRPNKRAELRG